MVDDKWREKESWNITLIVSCQQTSNDGVFRPLLSQVGCIRRSGMWIVMEEPRQRNEETWSC